MLNAVATIIVLVVLKDITQLMVNVRYAASLAKHVIQTINVLLVLVLYMPIMLLMVHALYLM